MSVLRNFFIFVGVLVLIIVGVFRYADHQESIQLRQAFEDRNSTLILHHLMASTKYAEDLRQLGYDIPPDGAIRHFGAMEFLELQGELPANILYAGESTIYVYFSTELAEGKTRVGYTLNESLDISSARYYRYNDRGRNEMVTISSEDDQRLLAIIQLEINDLIDRMEEQLYGEEKHDD